MKCELKINQDLLNRLTSIKKGKVEVGWYENQMHPVKDDGKTQQREIPIAKVAEINEFDTTIKVTDKMRKWFAANGFPLNKNTTEIHIPARSFMRSTCDEKQNDWSVMLNNNLKRVFAGKLTFEQALKNLGLRIKGDIQEKISEGVPPPNSGMTVIMKGKDTPLRDTSIMLESIAVRTEVE